MLCGSCLFARATRPTPHAWPRVLAQMAAHALWRDASDEELENAAEGLEKYLMNKLYGVCFQPALSDDALRDQVCQPRPRVGTAAAACAHPCGPLVCSVSWL